MNRRLPNPDEISVVTGFWSGLPKLSIPAASTIIMAICTAKSAVAQFTPAESLGNSAALEERGKQLEDQPYTFKSGDFRMLVAPSLGFQWNDNINLSHDQPLSDFIVSPELQLNGSYPFTSRNLIQFNIGLGYDKYVEHDAYSGVRVMSGSAISFDVYIKDFSINLHDRFQYARDTAGEPDVANTGFYGGFNNTAGLSGTWDLEDVVLTLGYDHLNFISSSSQFNYTDSATELVSAQAGCRFGPNFTAGVEGSAGFTRYSQAVLNNNAAYDGGLYAIWGDPYLQLKARGGYTFYDFKQTSLVIPAMNENTWYADLELTHSLSDAWSYSFGAGHDLRLGIQADIVEAWHLRPGVNWAFRKNWSFATGFSYENGKLGNSDLLGVSAEHYEWAGLDFGLAYHATSKLSLQVNYRLTLRSSDIEVREYSQNLVGIAVTYQFK